MRVKDIVKSLVVKSIVERPVRNANYADLRARLEKSRDNILRRVGAASDGPRNRALLGHIVGIERWGQSRLRTLLGAPLTMDEYDEYRPAKDTSWPDLVEAFQTARAETLALVDELAAAKAPLGQTVPHNHLGPLSARGWLRYLDMHAATEAKRIRS